MDIDEAQSRLLALLDAHRGSLTAAVAEADTELAQDQAATTSTAHQLASELDYISEQETGGSPTDSSCASRYVISTN
jgi:hypothetical protein